MSQNRKLRNRKRVETRDYSF
jgi:hypothetical protein